MCDINADLQVNKVNIVVRCSTGFLIPKTSLLENLNFMDRESVRTMFASFTCQSSSLHAAFVAH